MVDHYAQLVQAVLLFPKAPAPVALDQHLQAGDQFGIGGLDFSMAPTGWRSVAAARQAHERTRLTLAQPPLAGPWG